MSAGTAHWRGRTRERQSAAVEDKERVAGVVRVSTRSVFSVVRLALYVQSPSGSRQMTSRVRRGRDAQVQPLADTGSFERDGEKRSSVEVPSAASAESLTTCPQSAATEVSPRRSCVPCVSDIPGTTFLELHLQTVFCAHVNACYLATRSVGSMSGSKGSRHGWERVARRQELTSVRPRPSAACGTSLTRTEQEYSTAGALRRPDATRPGICVAICASASAMRDPRPARP